MPSSTEFAPADTGRLPATLDALVDEAARRWPGRIAVEHGDLRLTFGELRERVLAVAASLREPLRGRTAVLLFDNTPHCVVAFLALARNGARVVPAEPGSTRAQLEALGEELGGVTVLGGPERLAALGESAAPGEDRERLVDVAERFTAADTVDDASGAARTAHATDDEPGADRTADAPFLYQYSSGSTGAPKAAVHSQRNLVNGGRIYRESFGYGPEDTVLTAVPLLHSFGLVAGLVTTLLTGARLVVLGRFTPAALLRELERTEATVLVSTPLACDLLVRAAGRCTIAVRPRLCLSSGAALPPDTADRFATRFGVTVSQVYGCTEAGIIACQSGAHDGVGTPVAGVETRLVDDAGAPVPISSAGSLWVRTPALFSGYLNRPEATAEVLVDGWYATGDVARLDERGVLHLIGRKDTFINVGGKKVNPIEVERVLLGHPAIAEAVVWGETQPGGSERVRAAVVGSAPLTAEELTRHCRERLQPHQVPGGVEFRTELPKTSSGKIRRAAVAATATRSDQGGSHS
ncbi:class I adenylate-forming enzyme family protein [Streptomyces mexicanus]|jgi:acyl-CoA synthetase (AMP-forming)/AMP-acid ligase II|uniref:class I adenylate-forming enzyme family protein n=1 Tax=Streptomyces mexicanus TaxID=178566 RepID=UPI0036B5545D